MEKEIFKKIFSKDSVYLKTLRILVVLGGILFFIIVGLDYRLKPHHYLYPFILLGLLGALSDHFEGNHGSSKTTFILLIVAIIILLVLRHLGL